MTGAAIAAEVAAALADAGAEVGTGAPLTAIIVRSERTGGTNRNPIYADVPHQFTALIGQFSAREREASGIPMNAAKVTLSVGDVAPTTGDTLEIAGETFDVGMVMPYQPGGVTLYWVIEGKR